MRDIDEMLAEHDRQFPGDPLDDVGVVERLVEPQPEVDPEPYGPTPRTEWPGGSGTAWKAADLAERRWWVAKLYGEQGMNSGEVADVLGVGRSTVQRDAGLLGIGRPKGIHGAGSGKLAARDARRARIKRIVEERNGNVSTGEILRALGGSLHRTTILQDLQALGIQVTEQRTGPHLNGVDMTLERALGQMAVFGDLILNEPQLELVQLSPERVEEWARRLTKISRAVSRVRRHIRNQGENHDNP